MSTPLRIVLASNNVHKKIELGARLAHLPIELVQLDDPPDPDETGTTFRANALIKAIEFADVAGLPALADDSGLAVDALGGAPGVYSARFAEREGSRHAGHPRDLANNLELLDQLAGVDARGARFHCDLVLVAPAGSALWRWLDRVVPSSLPDTVECIRGEDDDLRALACHGTAEGTILAGRAELDAQGRLPAARGDQGFGYDPLFLSDALGVTFAEATAEQKNRVSHRAHALDGLVAALDAYCASAEATAVDGSDATNQAS